MFEEKLVGQLPVLLKALTMVVPSQFQAVLIFQFVSIGIECVDEDRLRENWLDKIQSNVPKKQFEKLRT